MTIKQGWPPGWVCDRKKEHKSTSTISGAQHPLRLRFVYLHDRTPRVRGTKMYRNLSCKMMILLFVLSLCIWDLWRTLQCRKLSKRRAGLHTTGGGDSVPPRGTIQHLAPVGNSEQGICMTPNILVQERADSKTTSVSRLAGSFRGLCTMCKMTMFREHRFVYYIKRDEDPSVRPTIHGKPAQSSSRYEVGHDSQAMFFNLIARRGLKRSTREWAEKLL